MKVYAQVDDKGKVFAISQIGCDLVKVSEYDSRLIGTTYDPVSDTFSGYRIKLSVDKAVIRADGEDTAIITVQTKDWKDDPTSELVVLSVGTTLKTVQTEDGIGTYTFSTVNVGEYTVKSTNEDAMDNDSLVIKVVTE